VQGQELKKESQIGSTVTDWGNQSQAADFEPMKVTGAGNSPQSNLIDSELPATPEGSQRISCSRVPSSFIKEIETLNKMY
jgi:hypothetical protein